MKQKVSFKRIFGVLNDSKSQGFLVNQYNLDDVLVWGSAQQWRQNTKDLHSGQKASQNCCFTDHCLLRYFDFFRLRGLKAMEHLQSNSQRVVTTEGPRLLLPLILDIKVTRGTVILPVPSPKKPMLKRSD